MKAYNTLPSTFLLWLLLLGVIAGVGLFLLFRTGAFTRESRQPPPTATPTPTPTLPPSVRLIVRKASIDVTIERSPTRRLETVRINPTNVRLKARSSLGLSAVAFDDLGRPVLGAELKWSISNPEAGQVSPGGVFTAGASPGTYPSAVTVAATSTNGYEGSAGASANITILPAGPPPISLTVFPVRLEVQARARAQLVASAEDANGVIVTDTRFSWEVIRSEAGTISPEGLFIAGNSPGEYPNAIRVTVHDSRLKEPLTNSIDVRVVEGPPQVVSVLVLPTLAVLKPGEDVSFIVVALDEDGNSLRITRQSWGLPNFGEWVRVGGRMVVRASPQEGVFPNAIEVDVSVELPNGETRNLTARVSVIIKQPPDPSTIVSPETGLSIFPESIVASPGETITLTVAGLESQGSTARLEWSLESTHLGELSQAGVLKVKNFPGSYPGAIKVKVVGQSTPGRETELKADLVIRGTLERIEAFPKSINIKPGDSVQLRVTAYDSNGVELPLGSARFRVTNPKAGRVDDRGVFIAGSEFGHYPGAIEVEVSQVVSTNE